MKKRLKYLVVIISIITLISLIIVKYIDNKIAPIIMDYSVSEVKRIISIIVNRSINSDLLENMNIDDLYIIKESEKGDILSLNTVTVNKITDIISDVCEDNLALVEERKYDELKKKFNITRDYFLVPSGLIMGKSLLINLGYDIPINFKILGSLSSNINTDVREYGLNNSLITISVSISIEIMIIEPFGSNIITINNDVPISIKLIQGKVPEIYGNIK